MKQFKGMVLVCAFMFFVFSCTANATTLLHSFAGGNDDGQAPYDGLAVSGNTFYGTTMGGGDNSAGVVFRTNAAGTGYTILHEFSGGFDGPSMPRGDILLSGSDLYGVTQMGGTGTAGVIYKVGVDGGGFSIMHEFDGSDGEMPFGGLTLSGSTLYGTTMMSGASGAGTLFKIDVDSTGFSVLHAFEGMTNVEFPSGGLTLIGSNLYGVSQMGGADSAGTIFRIGTDGSGLTLLHEFTNAAEDGASPTNGLTLSGGMFYGTANAGGGMGYAGTLYKMSTDGSGFTLLHKFLDDISDGSSPYASPIFVGDQLVGMTSGGGDSSEGVMYSINPDGTGYTLMYEFAGAPGDAGQPYGGLTLLDGVLYGLSSSGGSEGFGALFSDTTGVYDYINDSYGDISLTLDSTDIGDLSQLYYDGKAGQSPDPITVDDLQWSYVSGDLPDQGSHVLGDAYIYDGKYYFYLGSGLEGEGGGGGVPEPSTMLLVLPFLAGLYWMRKRRK